MALTRFTELDFFEIKDNLKKYLKSQKDFQDYEFEGSAMSTLLDILSYNTGYNGFYLNMLASEMFLDSAGFRESVVSHAKHLGYTPKSVSSLRLFANVRFEITDRAINIDALPKSVLITPKDQIYCVLDGEKYTFTPTTSTYLENPEIIYSINNAGLRMATAKFVATKLEFIEGKRFTHKWIVDNTLPVKQRYIIPNSDVDTSSIKVTVQDSEQSTNQALFTQFQDLNEITPTDLIYYVQEVSNSQYEVVFGDGVLGKKLEDGNVVNVEYVISSGNGATGATSFRPQGSFGGIKADNVYIDVLEAAGKYRDQETLDQIKFFAPRAYNTQNRAVTKNDYETLLKREIPAIKYLRVWGGEENVPPVYGKVFCAIQPDTGTALNEDEKNRILNTYIKPRSVLSIQVELVEPEYLSLIIDSTVQYFSNKTSKNRDDIKNLVYEKIKQFRTTYLSGFDADFRHSKLVKDIDSVDPTIESNLTTVKMKYRFVPAYDVPLKTTVTLNNPISFGDSTNNVAAVNSTAFLYNGITAYISDNGKGQLYAYYLSNQQKIIVLPDAGTVDYEKGIINIQNVVVSNIPNNLNYIDLIITPRINDVIALRNQILLLDDADISVTVVDLMKAVIS